MGNVFSLEKLTALPCFISVDALQGGSVFAYAKTEQEQNPPWSFTAVHPGYPEATPLAYPWRLDKWSIQRNLLDIAELEFVCSLDIRILAANLYQLCRMVGKEEIALDVKCESPGFYWVFGSFTLPHAVLEKIEPADDGPMLYTQKSFWGMKLAIYQKDDFLVCNETEHFAVGELPRDFFAMIPELILAAAGFVRSEAPVIGLFEQKVLLKSVREKLLGRICKEHFSTPQWLELMSRMAPPTSTFLGAVALSESRISLGYRSGIDEQNVPVPIEVLEERELRSKYAALDDAITRYEFGELPAHLLKLLDVGSSPYFFRRAALLAMIDRRPLDQEFLASQLILDPSNLLYLSLRVKPLFSTELAIELLRPLSILGQALVEKATDFTAIHMINVIYSELFGDAWFCVDFIKAHESYARILEEKEAYPRVLCKIIRLSRHWGEADNEIAYSFNYLKICHDELQLVYLYFRLAQLLSSRDIAEAILCGKKALHISPANEKIAIFVANLLLEIHKPSEAIDVLTSTIDVLSLKNGDEKLKIASLKLAIGNIWQHDLQRTDLALERFKDALELLEAEPANIALLSELHEIFFGYHASSETLEVYHKLFAANLTLNNMTEIFRLKPLILAAYDTMPGSEEKLADFYRCIIEHSLLNINEIYHVMALNEKTVFDWQRIYENFLKGKEPFSLDEKIVFQKQLGDIALTYLGDKKSAMKHYWQVIAHGEMDQGLFQFLFAYYQQNNCVEEYFRHLKNLTESASKELKKTFITEIMRHSEYLGDDEIDNYLISMLRIEGLTQANLLDRVSGYLAKDCLERAFKLLMVAVDGLDDVSQKIDLLWAGKSLLAGSSATGRFDHIQRIYLKLSSLKVERHDILLDAVRTFYTDDSKELLSPYVEEMLLGGEMPFLARAYFEEAFALRPAVLGRYYEIALFGESAGAERIDLAAKLLLIIEEMNIYREREIDLLALLAKDGWLGIVRTERLYDMHLALKQHEKIEQALTQQISFAPAGDADSLERLLRLAIRFYDEVLGEGAKLFKILDLLENLYPNNLSIMVEIAQYAHKYREFFKAKRLVFHCLDDERFWEDSLSVNKVFVWMVYEWDEKSIIANIVRNKLQMKIKARDWNAADRIAVYLEKFELYDLKTAYMAFEAAAERGDEARMSRAWLEASLKIEDEETLTSFLHDVEKLIERTSRSPFFRKLLAMDFPLEKNPFLKKVIPEYQLMLATTYLGGEVTEQIAYDILNAHFSSYPEDMRAWMPLYFILKGRDAKDELVTLLRRILPRLEEDEQALAQFPVTLESLRNEVDMFDGQTSLPRTAETSHKRTITGDSQPSLDRSSPTYISSTNQPTSTGESTYLEATHHLFNEASGAEPAIPLEKWRDVVLAFQVTPGMTDALINTPFDNEIEKHVAVQTYAIISGEFTALKRWKYQVWRDVDKFVYPRSSRERTADIDMRPATRIMYFNEFNLLTDFLLAQNGQNFSVIGLAHKLGIKGEDVIAQRRSVNWHDRFFDKTLMKHYTTQLTQMHFVIFHMKGLGRDLFYDAKYRAIYFDAEYFGKMPPSYIFHRIMLHLRAVMAGYHAWLFSDLRNGVVPFVGKARKIMLNSLSATMKSAIGMGLSPGDVIADSDGRIALKQFFLTKKEVGLPEIEGLIQGMWRTLYAWQAAETLDIIGLCEAIWGVDITSLKAKEIRLASSSHSEIRELLAFVTCLRF